ncbi:butyrophilin subfamily 1 member A1-like [Pelobates fuscus]|uniref:butyrophilin subfamily 1 member A1-like n=1 Tax=Pelobates fuscus TaxID=191477 RepID=UPI002FE4F07D
MLLNGTYQRFTSLSVNLLIQLLILYLPLGSSLEEFDVIATKTPIYITVGSAVELSFHLSPETSAVNLDIQISRSFSSQFIVYHSSHGVIQSPMEEYKERIQLVTKHLTMGKVSLLIRDIVPFDNGTYRCLFKMGINSKEGDLDLVVTALGTDPLIRMTKNHNKDFTAHCESEGWYPEPTILWKSGSGDTLQPLSEQKYEKPSGLFTVQSSMIVTSGGFLSCTVQNIQQNEKRKTEIVISETLYKKMDCCGMYRIFTCLLVFILPVSSMIFVSIWEKRLHKTLRAKEDEMNKQLASRKQREKQNKREISK